MIRKEEITLKNIIAFFQGNVRWVFWKTKFLNKLLLRSHIREQITYRMNSINKKCRENGSCVHCGCEIPQLLMANKSCGGNCYPIMMNKKTWEARKEQSYVYIQEEKTGIYWSLNKKMKKFYKKEEYALERTKPKFRRRKSGSNN